MSGTKRDATPQPDGDFTADRFLQDRSLQHDVYAVIVEWIHQGTLRPGDRVSEAAVARQLGISRGPVREAISRLDYEGLVVRRPRREPIVSKFSVKDIEDITVARQLIEGQAARCACQRLTASDEQILAELIDAMHDAAATGQWTESALLNARFHQTVVEISGNKVLERMWHALHPLAWVFATIQLPNRPQDPESIVVRHQQLLDVLRSGDPARSDAAFRRHVLLSSRGSVEQMRELAPVRSVAESEAAVPATSVAMGGQGA